MERSAIMFVMLIIAWMYTINESLQTEVKYLRSINSKMDTLIINTKKIK